MQFTSTRRLWDAGKKVFINEGDPFDVSHLPQQQIDLYVKQGFIVKVDKAPEPDASETSSRRKKKKLDS